MNTLKVSVRECKEKQVLAADVTNSNGVVLVAKDTVINEFIKDKLTEIGIGSISIYKHAALLSAPELQFEKDYKETVLQIKSLLNELAAGKRLDYEKVKYISSQIYTNFNANEFIVKYLQEVRSADEYTYTHCLNTAFYSMLTGKWMKLSDSDIIKLIQAGLLHDIGKVKVPTDILNKGGILTKDEFEVIKKHTIFGYEMLEGIDDIAPEVKQAVLHHHERIDCSGYPYKASSEEVNLYAKIIAVADVFDAMTSDRVYKKKVSPFDAFEMFLMVGIKSFDTIVLNTFIKRISTYFIGSKVLMNNGQTAEIVYIPPQDVLRPIILLNEQIIDLSHKNDLKISEIV